VEKTGSLSATVTSTPAGIDCGASCSHAFPVGSEVTLAVEPSEPGACVSWSGGGCPAGGALDCAVTLEELSPDHTLVSVAVIPRHELTIALEGSGTGVVTSEPVGIDCGPTCNALWCEGTSVELTATPASGGVFAGFSGGECTGGDTCTVVLQADEQVIATFDAADTDDKGDTDDTEDTDDTGDTDDTRGCQCSMSPARRGLPLNAGLAMLALSFVALRRPRTSRPSA